MKIVRLLFVLLAIAATPASAQFGACLPGFCRQPPVSCVNSGHAAAFIARTSGLNGTHIAAYTTLLNGLDAAALSCKFDVLQIYATQDSATALLNLIQNLHNGTAHGSPTFTADQGYDGVDGSNTVYIDTGFNPNIAVAPKFVTLTNHTSVFRSDNLTSNNASVGSADATNINFIIVRKNGGGGQPNWTFFCADQISSQCLFGPLGLGSTGRWIESRINSGATRNYFNAALQGGGTNSSIIPNFNMYTLGYNNNGTPVGAAGRVSGISFGGTLDATEISNFDTLLSNFFTAVGCTC